MRSEARTATPLATESHGVCVCLSSTWFKSIHESVICFGSQSRPSSLVRFTTPHPLLSSPSLHRSEWLLCSRGFGITQHHTSLMEQENQRLYSPSPLPRGFQSGGRRGSRGWWWRWWSWRGWADVQTQRDGRFYKRYGNTERDEHFHYRNIPLPATQPVVLTQRARERHSLMRCRGC